MSSLGLIAHFFLVLGNLHFLDVPVYLPIHRLKGILVTSQI